MLRISLLSMSTYSWYRVQFNQIPSKNLELGRSYSVKVSNPFGKWQVVIGSFPKHLAFLFIGICYMILWNQVPYASDTDRQVSLRGKYIHMKMSKLFPHCSRLSSSPSPQCSSQSSRFERFWSPHCLPFLTTLVIPPVGIYWVPMSQWKQSG